VSPRRVPSRTAKPVRVRRVNPAKLAASAWGFLRRPRNVSFLGVFLVACFTAGPIMRYCKDHRYFTVRRVEVRGTERVPEARVRMWLGMVEGESIWRASPQALEESLRQHPPIADAHVRRILPNRIEVTVLEREPGAMVRDASGFYLADDEGVLFERAEPTAALPIVTVVTEGEPFVGPPEPPAKPALAKAARAKADAPKTEVAFVPEPAPEALGDASALPRRILAEAVDVATRLEAGLGGIGVSEVTLRAGTPPAYEPELVVFSSDGRLVVRFGWGAWDEKLGALQTVLANARDHGFFGEEPPAGDLDVRDPELVVARWAEEGTA